MLETNVLPTLLVGKCISSRNVSRTMLTHFPSTQLFLLGQLCRRIRGQHRAAIRSLHVELSVYVGGHTRLENCFSDGHYLSEALAATLHNHGALALGDTAMSRGRNTGREVIVEPHLAGGQAGLENCYRRTLG